MVVGRVRVVDGAVVNGVEPDGCAIVVVFPLVLSTDGGGCWRSDEQANPITDVTTTMITCW